MKIALITGINGQDGSYLAELLLQKKYQVWGLIRRSSDINTQRIDHLYQNPNLVLRYADLTDSANINNVISQINQRDPTILEVYNLAAMSHVKVSFEMPEYTGNVDGLGALRLLEAIRSSPLNNRTRFYQASTSELYGLVQETPQKETTPFYPRSPYAVAKLYAYWIVKNYREAYGMYACNGILFNHESPRRGPTFVTRKITRGLDMIINGTRDTLEMGNLDATRDWGHARDYVYGMWLMLQQENPEDFVLATNESHSVREFIERAFLLRGIDIIWKGEGVDEVGIDKTNPDRVLIRINPRYYRPSEVDNLLGDPSKAKTILGWNPTCNFDDLVEEMVKYDSTNID